MRITRTAVLDARGGSFATAWERLLDAVHAGEIHPSHYEIRVEDRPGARRSDADLAHRRLGGIARVQTHRGRRLFHYVGCFDAEASQLVGALARAIPRPISGWSARVSLVSGAQLASAAKTDDARPFSPIEAWDRRTSVERRMDELWLTYSEQVPVASPTEPLDVPTSLGEIGWERTLITLSPEQVRFARSAAPLVLALFDGADAPHVDAPRAATGSPRARNWKKPFERSFSGAWTYDELESRPRFHLAHRRTPGRNSVAIVADIGGHGTPRRPSLDLRIERPELSVVVGLMDQSTVETQAQWDDVCELARRELDRVWDSTAAGLDSVLGDAPEWNGRLPHVSRVDQDGRAVRLPRS